jgi:hypothetical protein
MFQEYFKCRHISHKSECPQVVVDKIVQLKVREKCFFRVKNYSPYLSLSNDDIYFICRK